MTPRTEAGQTGLAALRASASTALVALDYDGTLAPIVSDPADAVPVPGAVEALVALAGHVGRVAIITGRPAEVVLELGGLAVVPGLQVMGQYGVDRWSGGVLVSEPPHPGLEAARAALPAMVARVGAALEDKGSSLVVHTRNAPRGALERLVGPAQELGQQTGLEVHPGRMVLELRPPGFDKRGALLAVAEPLPSAVLFAGDDVGDGAAYDAVDELRARGVPGLTVFSDSVEGPEELRDRADVVVDGPVGLIALLRDLIP